MQDILAWITGHAWLLGPLLAAVALFAALFVFLPSPIRDRELGSFPPPEKPRWWRMRRPVSAKAKRIELDEAIAHKSKTFSDKSVPLDVGLELDSRSLGLLLATTRDWQSDTELGFLRSPLTFGSAVVRVPEDHRPGRVERPWQVSVFGWTLYRETEVASEHFTLKSVRRLDRGGFIEAIGLGGSSDAIVFVHGFNNSLDDCLFRLAQIVWDSQFTGVPIAFSWPSRTGVLNYPYDRESAVYSVNGFIELLDLLHNETRLSSVHVIAHSMGNQIVTEALTRLGLKPPPRKLGEIILAAPDVDWDVFLARAPSFKDLSRGVTLYASSADKALVLSRNLANGPRAGDVLATGPLVAPNVDTIDVTSMGDEMFGLNHDTFAANRSLIDDMALLIGQGLRPPNKRLAQIRGAPEGTIPPQYWRYA